MMLSIAPTTPSRHQLPEPFREIVGELCECARRLEGLSDIESPLDRLVAFFMITSHWHDREGTLRTISKTVGGENRRDLQRLRKRFIHAGRHMRGFNQTVHGQEVTPETVFLGEIHDLAMHPVSYWMHAKEMPKRITLPDGSAANGYEIVCVQADEIVTTNTKVLLELIQSLKNERL